MNDEITFIPGFHCNSNSSQYDFAWGSACRLILMSTVLLAIYFLAFVQRSFTYAPGAHRAPLNRSSTLAPQPRNPADDQECADRPQNCVATIERRFCQRHHANDEKENCQRDLRLRNSRTAN